MSRTIVYLQWMEFSSRLVSAISGWHRQPRRRLSLPMENWGKRTHQIRDGVSPMLSGDRGKFTVPRDEKFMYRLELNAILDKQFSRWHWWKIWWLQIRLEDRVTTRAYFVASLSSLLQGNRRELSVSRNPPELQRMECTRVGFSCLDLTIQRWHWQPWWRMPLSVVPGVYLLWASPLLFKGQAMLVTTSAFRVGFSFVFLPFIFFLFVGLKPNPLLISDKG